MTELATEMNKKENWPFLLELKKKQKQKQKITVKYGSNEHAFNENSSVKK